VGRVRRECTFRGRFEVLVEISPSTTEQLHRRLRLRQTTQVQHHSVAAFQRHGVPAACLSGSDRYLAATRASARVRGKQGCPEAAEADRYSDEYARVYRLLDVPPLGSLPGSVFREWILHQVCPGVLGLGPG